MALQYRQNHSSSYQLLITKRRVRSVERYLGELPVGTQVVIGLTNVDRFLDKMQEIGFSPELQDGETILPNAETGPICKYNAEGKYRIHKDLPKETVYRTAEWHWQQWHGRHRRVEVSRLVDIPYRRYPRTFIPPPSVELMLARDINGNTIIRTPSISYEEENREILLHRINLFLEIFRECRVLTGDLEQITIVPVRRLNWNILPPGRRPWSQLKRDIEPIVMETRRGNRAFTWQRLGVINSFQPEFHAIGHAGFRGYIIFGFPERNLFILESIKYGNATYIFGEKWEDLSRMTKAEIITGNLHIDRIIHQRSWERRLREAMNTD